MTVVQINVTCGIGSTGKICLEIANLLDEKNIENYIFYSQGQSYFKDSIKLSDAKYIKLQALKSRVFGNYGFCAKNATKKLIKSLKAIMPDVIHIHNIHGHNVNLKLLFDYIKANKIKVYWTFHDCWAFTGYCVHFDMVGCEKWKTGCNGCPLRKQYSWFFDKSEKLYKKKKELLAGLDLTIITPSKWLAKLVKESFLKGYEVKVINNGIDLDTFKPTKSNFKEKLGLQDKYIVLGVAMPWSRSKGLDVFIELSKKLGDCYQIVLVGTDDNIDRNLPKEILSIHRTNSVQELVQIYSSSDVFVNPTREDTYPTVNMEALACGTPVVSFNTGGSAEIVDSSCGIIVNKDDVDALIAGIKHVCENKPYSKEKCCLKSQDFDRKVRYKEYMELYNE